MNAATHARRKNAVEILRMELATRLAPAAVIGFVLMCMLLMSSRNAALDISIAGVWLVLASVAMGAWLIERHAAKELHLTRRRR